MKKGLEHRRCGECGRSFTKNQWRRNNFWCNQCHKYECSRCIGNGRICPSCGNKMNRKMSDRRFFLIIFSFTYLAPILLMTTLLFFYEDRSIEYVAFPLSILIIVFVLAYFFHNKIKIQIREHSKHINKMPKGIIPLKDRPSYYNQAARQKWSEEHNKGTLRSSRLMNGVFNGTEFMGLVGDWDFPIMSKEERIYKARRAQQNGKRITAILIAFSIVIIILNVITINHHLIWVVGITMLFLGILFLIVLIYSKKLIEKDIPLETKVPWNIVGFMTTKRSIESFLKSINEEYQVETEEWPKKLLWNNPKYRYILKDKTEIQSMYSESKDGSVYGWIAIVYHSYNYQTARRIQKKLDDYFVEKDLIVRGR